MPTFRLVARRPVFVGLAYHSLAVAICLAATLATGSRTALCCFILVVLLLAGFSMRLRPKRLALALLPVAIIGAALLLMPAGGVAIGRYRTLADDVATRSTIYSNHFAAAMKHKWAGYGLGSFNTVNNALLDAENYRELSVIRSAHDVYLQWFETVGGIGLFAVALVNIAIFAPLLAGLRRDRSSRGIIGGVCAVYVTFMLHGTVDYAFQEPALCFMVAAFLGIAVGRSLNFQKATRIQQGLRRHRSQHMQRVGKPSEDFVDIEVNNHVYRINAGAMEKEHARENLAAFRNRIAQLKEGRPNYGNGELFLMGAFALLEEMRVLAAERDRLRSSVQTSEISTISNPAEAADTGARIQKLYGRSKKRAPRSA